MASLYCPGNADVNKTCVITNFHVYIVQLRQPSSDIVVIAYEVNAQSGEVYSLKKSSHLKPISVCLGHNYV